MDGNDGMIDASSGPNQRPNMLGRNGHDYLASYHRGAWLEGDGGPGEAGNDIVRAVGNSRISRLVGGAGNDCLDDQSMSATAIVCGDGHDKVRDFHPQAGDDCEEFVTACPASATDL
jgi:hypothetical protein